MLLELVQGGELWSLVYNEKCVARFPWSLFSATANFSPVCFVCVFCVCLFCVCLLCGFVLCGCGVQVTSDAW